MTPLANGRGVSIDGTTCFFVQPIYRSGDPDELIGFVPPSLNSRFVCNYFAFHDQHQKETILTSAECVGPEGSANIKFFEDGWQAKQLAVRVGYLDDVAEQIRPQF
jgi:hypothetical protein